MDSRHRPLTPWRHDGAGAGRSGSRLPPSDRGSGPAFDQLDRAAAAEPFRAHAQAGAGRCRLHETATAVPAAADDRDGHGGPGAVDCVRQPRQPDAGARDRAAQRDCGAVRARRGARPPAAAAADRKRAAGGARRRGRPARCPRVPAGADGLSAAGFSDVARRGARCARPGVHGDRVGDHRAAVRPCCRRGRQPASIRSAR